MFVKTIEEILEPFPTSVWNEPEKLVGLIEDEESALLRPILGDVLIKKLHQRDKELREKYGRIDAEGLFDVNVDSEDEEDIRLLRFIRKAVVFRMGSNNVMNLSTSFNQGGGMNRMSTDGYEGENIKELEKLSQEYWHSSQRAIENILTILTADAQRPEPRYKKEWQSAKWYYTHGELLFPTSGSMEDYYTFDKERPNAEYQKLVPYVRFCQQTYIAPVFGSELMKLLRDQIGKEGKTEEPSGNAEGTVAGEESSGNAEGAVAGEPSGNAEGTVVEDVLHTALSMTQQALGMFVAYKADKTAKREVLTTADQALANAIQYIMSNKEAFGDAVKKAKFYVEEEEDKGKECCCRRREGIDNWGQGFTKLF